MSESFVNTLKRDHAVTHILTDTDTTVNPIRTQD